MDCYYINKRGKKAAVVDFTIASDSNIRRTGPSSSQVSCRRPKLEGQDCPQTVNGKFFIHTHTNGKCPTIGISDHATADKLLGFLLYLFITVFLSSSIGAAGILEVYQNVSELIRIGSLYISVRSSPVLYRK